LLRAIKAISTGYKTWAWFRRLGLAGEAAIGNETTALILGADVRKGAFPDELQNQA